MARRSDHAGLARLLSALFSASTTYLTYLTGVQVLRSWRLGLLAAVLLAVSPADIALAQEARMYPLLELLTVVSILVLNWARNRNTGWSWLAYAASCALLPWTQYYGFFVLAAHAVSNLIMSWRRPQLLLRAYLALALAALLFVPWLPSFLAQLSTAHSGFWVPPFGWLELGETGRQLTFATPPDHGTLEDPLTFWGSYVYGALAVAGAILVVARQRRALLLPMAVVAPILLAALVSKWLIPVYYTRYVLFTLPAFILLTAVGLVDLDAPFSFISRRSTQAIILAILVTGSLVCANSWFTDDYYARPATILGQSIPR